MTMPRIFARSSPPWTTSLTRTKHCLASYCSRCENDRGPALLNETPEERRERRSSYWALPVLLLGFLIALPTGGTLVTAFHAKSASSSASDAGFLVAGIAMPFVGGAVMFVSGCFRMLIGPSTWIGFSVIGSLCLVGIGVFTWIAVLLSIGPH